MIAQNLQEWRAIVLAKETQCQICNSTINLIADHLESVHSHPELILETNNGGVLCRHRHLKFGAKVSQRLLEPKPLNLFGNYRMQLLHQHTIRTTIPNWLVGLILKAKGIEKITTQQLTSNFRVVWYYGDLDNRTSITIEPKRRIS